MFGWVCLGLAVDLVWVGDFGSLVFLDGLAGFGRLEWGGMI